MPSTIYLVIATALLASPPEPASPGDRERAERSFDEAQKLYDRGEYDAAIAQFSESYRLFPAPIIIFDIAQAHRMRGDCPDALREYRHFRELAPEAPEADLAEQHIRALHETCGAPAPPATVAPPPVAQAPDSREAAAVSVAPVNGERTPPPVDPTGRYRWVRFSALALGLATGTAAIGLDLGGRDQFLRWKSQDQSLARGPAMMTRESQETWLAQQRENDRLAGSIRSRQHVCRVIGAMSIIGLVAGTLLSFPSLFRW